MDLAGIEPHRDTQMPLHAPSAPEGGREPSVRSQLFLESRHMGALALAGVAAFTLVCVAAHYLRSDIDWIRAPLSFYLLGKFGWLVKSAYFMLGASLILLGVGYYRVLGVPARSGAPLLLFVMAGLALPVTALADSSSGTGARTLEMLVHGVAAATAFLCATTAMMLQAWRLRADVRWRGRFALAFALAAASFVAMWAHALWREAPRGLSQKLVIAMILAWLAMAAWWLRKADRLEIALDRSPEPNQNRDPGRVPDRDLDQQGASH